MTSPVLAQGVARKNFVSMDSNSTTQNYPKMMCLNSKSSTDPGSDRKFFSQRVQNLHYKLDQYANLQCPDIIGSILECELLLTLLILPMPGPKSFRDSFSFAFSFLDLFKKTWEFSKQFSLTAIEAQESWRHRIWSVPQKISKFLAHTEASNPMRKPREFDWKCFVGLLCFKNNSVIKISISLWRASKQSSWKKVFVEKILKSDKKKLNKKLSRKEKKNVENVSQVF